MKRVRTFAAWGLALALISASPTASAFCRTSSCELGENPALMTCERDDRSNCVTEGKPLHWGSPCLEYAVQAEGSARSGIDGARFRALIDEAFAAWQGVECPGGGSPRFQAQFQGFVSCDKREAVCGGADRNVNVMMFHDQAWPESPGVIGLTTPSGGTQSGLVVDADLELNSQDFDFSATASPTAVQLKEVLAHEIGHFLGLSHNYDPGVGALMSEDYQSLALSRELLTPDDIAAICAVYPPGAPLKCAAPGQPAYDECQVDPSAKPACTLPSMTHDRSSGGCSVGAGSPQPGPGALALLVGLVLLRRRR